MFWSIYPHPYPCRQLGSTKPRPRHWAADSQRRRLQYNRFRCPRNHGGGLGGVTQNLATKAAKLPPIRAPLEMTRRAKAHSWRKRRGTRPCRQASLLITKAPNTGAYLCAREILRSQRNVEHALANQRRPLRGTVSAVRLPHGPDRHQKHTAPSRDPGNLGVAKIGKCRSVRTPRHICSLLCAEAK
jgi:hypothetical protein